MDQIPALGQPDDAQHFAIHPWPEPWPDRFPAITPARRVIALFGTRLPEPYLEAMASQPIAPVWINLEYLTAEAWATGCHGLTSPHPRLPLSEHFYFPGVTPGTGGVIMEPDLGQEWTGFERTAFLAKLGIPEDGRRLMSLFSYDSAALDGLIDTCSAERAPGWRILTFVTPALPRLAKRVARPLGQAHLAPGTTLQLGSLELRVLPWLTQNDYDRLLWSCDFNIVRGEDSFVRAQLAGRPLLWQPYVQAEGTHLVKLDAFLDHYTHGLTDALAQSVYTRHHAFSRGETPGQSPQLALPSLEDLATLTVQALSWRKQIVARGDLAEHLLKVRPD